MYDAKCFLKLEKYFYAIHCSTLSSSWLIIWVAKLSSVSMLVVIKCPCVLDKKRTNVVCAYPQPNPAHFDILIQILNDIDLKLIAH